MLPSSSVTLIPPLSGGFFSCATYNLMFKTHHYLYDTWETMRKRCFNPNYRGYHNYGGRGITICDRWNDFWLFVEDMGDRPIGHTLERKDNDGNYEPSNCMWATRSQQCFNRRPFTIPHRSLQMPNTTTDMRNIRVSRRGRYEVRMRVNKQPICKWFNTLDEALAFRADLEDERAMMALLS